MALLALTALSCSCGLLGIGPSSSVAKLATRTPWPTFTPTFIPTPRPVAVVQASPINPTQIAVVTPPLAQQNELPPSNSVPVPSPNEPPTQPAGDTPVPPSNETPVPPTLPPTSPATSTPLPTETPTVAPTATSTNTPVPAVTPAVESPGWSLAGVRINPDEYEEGLLLFGDLINDTGSPQALAWITGTFYDSQGQVIAGEESIYDYWPPIDVIPPGGHMPFELNVDGLQSAANFTLRVEAEPSSESPRQDFTFSDLSQWNEENDYCVQGVLQSPGDSLNNYLVIVAVLYDEQGNVVNFGDYYEPYLEGDQALTFEICAGPPNQGVVRYELRAWGS